MNKLREKLLKGMLDLIVLRLIAERPTHGYKIMKTLQKRYNISFAPSTIYPLLTVLTEEGLVESEWVFQKRRQHQKSGMKKTLKTKNRPCKVYTITMKGRTLLGQGEGELKAIIQPFMQVKHIA